MGVCVVGNFFDTLAGQKIAFIGAGVSHHDLIPMFAKAGATVTLCDKKERAALGDYAVELEGLGVTMCLGEHYLGGLAGQDMILRTPGFAFFTPELQAAKSAGAVLTSEMELFFAHCPCRIAGVTGSDGKTTTTSLIAAMYEAAGRRVYLGGNIGKPLLPIVDGIAPGDIAVVELSSFQLISMRASPDIAVVTNVTPNHLDHHRDMDEYIGAKRNILLHQKPDGIAVLGGENRVTRSMERDTAGECRWFSHLRRVGLGAYLRREDGTLCLSRGGEPEPVVHSGEIALRGEHNRENMLAAFAAVMNEVPLEAMAQTARVFKGVEHRLEPVRRLDGVEWFNDSIATSPTRVIAGLRALGQDIVLIAGGYDKNVPFEPMAEDIIKRVKLLILTGAAAQKIEAAVRGQGGFSEGHPAIEYAAGMAEAVRTAYERARPGDVVTLSPGAAAFDAYLNFEARGRHFKELVNAL